MRAVASKGDLYGPSAQSATVRSTILNANASNSSPSVQKTSAQIPVTQLFGNLRGSIMGKPLTWLFGLIGVLIAYKLIEEHRGGKEAFDEVKIGLNNTVKIGLLAMLFFVLAKFLATKYEVPGASSFVRYATGG